MDWKDKLERKAGRFSIRNLMTYIVVLNLAVYILSFLNVNGNLIEMLSFDPSLVLKGQVWRIITFIFIPPSASPVFIIFVLYFYYIIGSSLENEWGTFKFNLYYFIGMMGTAAAALLTGQTATSAYLNLSLFLAFAAFYPEYEILLFFVLPVKVKYLAWLDWAMIAYTVLFLPLSFRISALVSVINYFVFFGRDIINYIKMKRKVYYNRKRFFKEIHRK